MWEQIRRIWRVKELRVSILAILGMIVIFRLVAHIPLPGINVIELQRFFEQSQFFGLLNIFSGGTLKNFSIVMLGVAPYITASIIMQLLQMINPRLEEMAKEEATQKKIQQYTRLLTVPLALIQAYSMINLLKQANANIFTDTSVFYVFGLTIMITAGTIFLMWLGELMTEKKLGNGLSILIFAGILAQFPQTIAQAIAVYDSSQLLSVLGIVAVGLVSLIAVIYVSEAQRHIPISYATQMKGRSVGGTYIPLRVNQAGVIPIIFAISMLLFPTIIAQLLMQAQSPWLQQASSWVLMILNKQGIEYAVLYFFLVFGFSFFYTFIVFQPEKVAENLQKQGAFIPGVRPGSHTIEYIAKVTSRVTFWGGLFLATIAILPIIMQHLTGMATVFIGGTSLLIVVSVVVEIVKQVESQIVMREYDAF